jgi:hypothetical protein
MRRISCSMLAELRRLRDDAVNVITIFRPVQSDVKLCVVI